MPPSPRVRRPLWHRLWLKVLFPSDPTACWLWGGATSLKRCQQRRPVIQVAGRGSPVAIVSRLVCGYFHGPPPTPLHEAGHTCPGGEQALCVNPAHLQWMTRTENERWKQASRRRRARQGATAA